jgi:hypothetical protein
MTPYMHTYTYIFVGNAHAHATPTAFKHKKQKSLAEAILSILHRIQMRDRDQKQAVEKETVDNRKQ